MIKLIDLKIGNYVRCESDLYRVVGIHFKDGVAIRKPNKEIIVCNADNLTPEPMNEHWRDYFEDKINHHDLFWKIVNLMDYSLVRYVHQIQNIFSSIEGVDIEESIDNI